MSPSSVLQFVNHNTTNGPMLVTPGALTWWTVVHSTDVRDMILHRRFTRRNTRFSHAVTNTNTAAVRGHRRIPIAPPCILRCAGNRSRFHSAYLNHFGQMRCCDRASLTSRLSSHFHLKRLVHCCVHASALCFSVVCFFVEWRRSVE